MQLIRKINHDLAIAGQIDLEQLPQIVLQEIRCLPKPVLVHCDNAIRSAAIALMHIATYQEPL